MDGYILAHDLGTSGNKATLYRPDGTLAAAVVAAYPVSYPHPGWVEQDPEDWWGAVCTSTRELLEKSGAGPEEILCVSFSAQMMGCLLVDREGAPLRPMITWADTRAKAEERFLCDAVGMEQIYAITGHRASASYSAAKLLWVKSREPELYHRAYRMLHAKDFIVYRLTGRFLTDYSDASGTNLFDLRKKCWSEEICRALDIPMDLLPQAVPSATVAGAMLPQAAGACGLRPGTPVVLGGGDGSCACVGAGVTAPDSAYCVMGSSAWISMASTAPVFDREMRTFNWLHLDPDLYTPCGTMQTAGLSYSWFRDALCPEERRMAAQKGISVYEIINAAAEKTPPGAGGLLYLPYLLGERSPWWDRHARGAFVGLSASTGRGEMARAVMEGVGFNLRAILESLQEQVPVEALTMIGGGTKGRLWLQILSDIWQKPLSLPAYREEATSLGAAVCGGVGIGLYPDYHVAASMNPKVEELQPSREMSIRYQALYDAFNAAYAALKPVYCKLSELREGTP